MDIQRGTDASRSLAWIENERWHKIRTTILLALSEAPTAINPTTIKFPDETFEMSGYEQGVRTALVLRELLDVERTIEYVDQDIRLTNRMRAEIEHMKEIT